jgi:lambda family phage tail tape measure protein
VADFRLNVTADTQRAERDLRQLNQTADSATKPRQLKIDLPSIRDVNKTFSNLGRDVNDAANNIKTFYKVAKQLPGVGENIKRYEGALTGTAKAATTLANNTKAGDILANSFNKASSSVGGLVNGLAKVGFALFGVKEILGVLQSAFGGFFQQTIGREIKLRETILKTQTTLASTNKVFRNGSEITDPYEKIVALTGEVQKRIDSIRERSIALAGVTSNEVIEVFGIVASQIGQIGGGLKEAEDLAINFSAALGTFGIPLYQARQEIGSILRGDITTDSYLAKALGITNEEVARAKTQAGGVVKFLEDRLAASIAGQRIAAQGFSGVVSNIRDLGELVAQRFGAGLLDPLLNALAGVFERLFKIREQLFSLADAAGQFIGRFAAIGQVIRERSGLVSLGDVGLKDNSGSKAINDLKDAIQDVVVLIEAGMQRAIGAVAQIITTLQPAVMTVADAFIRLGKSFVEIKVDVFETLARALANVISFYSKFIELLATGFNLYSQLLDIPIVQEFAKLAATMGLLKRAGMDFITNALVIGNTLIRVVVPALGGVGVAIATLLGGIAVLIAAVGKLAIVFGTLAASLVTLPTMAAGVAKALQEVSNNLIKAGNDAVNTGGKIETVAGGFKNLGDTVRLTAMNLVKSVGMIFLVQAAITVLVNAFGEYQKRAEETSKTKRAELALERLGTVYRNVGDDADYATKAARDFERQLAQAEYGRATERIEEIRKRLNDLRYEGQLGIQTWSEFWRLFDLRDTVSRALGGNADQQRVGALISEQARLRDYQRKYEAQQNLKDAQANIKLQADQRRNLESEIKDIRTRQENELFQKRQELAQKEVEIFRVAGELRIFQMEEANKKLIEGEEGASRTALEALNNYLAVRERGELDIEAGKQEIAISIANMEKEIENYKLENAKTIAKIKKDSAQYEEAVAKNIETIKRNGANAQNATGAAIKQGFLVGSTGRSTGPHLDIRSPANDTKAVVDEAMLIVKAWQNMGVEYIQLSNTKEDVKNLRDDNRLRAALIREQQAHAKRARGGAIDIAVPSGTLVPRRTSTPSLAGNGGYQATSLDTGNIFLHGLPTSVASRGEVTPVTTKAPNFDQYGTPAVEKYAAAVRGVASAMERLRVLQAALTEAKTAAAFTEIAKAMFPMVNIEQYQDKLDETRFALTELGKASATSFDPDRVALTAEYNGELNSRARELAQLLETAAKQLKPDEFYKLWTQLKASNEKFKQDLAAQNKLKQDQLRLDKARNALQETLNRSRSRQESTADSLLRTRLRLEGMSPELVDAEVQKEQARRGLAESLQNPETRAGAQAALDAESAAIDAEALAKLAENDPLTGLLGKWKSEIKDTRSMVASLAQTFQTEVSGAMSNAVMGVINGTTTVQEAFSNLFQNIAKAFLDMAVQIIAKQITMLIFGTLLKALGVPLGGGGGGGDMFKPNFSAMEFVADGGAFGQNGIIPFAKGGVVSKPTLFRFAEGASLGTGVMGEAGPEGILPLTRGPNGKLGVSAYGNSGNVNVVVNVDATGSKVEGDDQKANALGRVVSAAVQQEIIKQKRPGGLLA